jgi:hypothetical protein
MSTPSNNENDDPSTLRVIVVGKNRLRLNKIMTLVQELEGDEGVVDSSFRHHAYLPCLAAMDSYDDANGNPVTYMSTFATVDGSPMTKYLDDDKFRQSLQLILLVGYEWNELEDQPHIESYFLANQLADNVVIKCVRPNDTFSTLHEEMQYFKNLSEEEKAEQNTQKELGPCKMARFVVDIVKALKLELHKEGKTGEDQTKQEEEAETTETAATSVLQQAPPPPKPALRIDPLLTIFACRMCRVPLLDESQLAEGHRQNLHSFKRSSKGSSAQSVCQSLFCDETVLAWLSDDSDQVEGRLRCYKCANKLGHWNWSGAQCSCGTWVVPAIQIPMSKVDAILPRNDAAGAAGSVTASVVMPRIFS